MPRRKSEWDEQKENLLCMQEASKTVEEREFLPDTPCGKCKNFSAASFGSGIGRCIVLKTGSDISSDPPVFILEGEVNMTSDVKMDASKCTYFDKMDLIDTDIAQAYDPRYSRHIRQMQK
ncbi:MAG: hypothetical protein SVY53_04655 [Chloroflexota bacterium]|nr:hypothetical protein [Chloroflexota bacterium]